MANSNWVHDDTLRKYKDRAKATVSETNKQHEGKRQVTIPHPTLRKTWIIKYI